MKKQYAFLLMGENFNPERHRTRFETEGYIWNLYTVRNPEEAKAKVLALAEDGVGAIELCGAFGPELARELTTLTGGQVAIGYVIHDKEQDNLFIRFFS